ncbi:urea ABC transporter permease subunit UrtB [Marinovum sp. 2_MG-2023]|uniref:urea ABC transporter permease subunit UrtB n=1 Tax=Roseobacteraceae TaxID=2854170 RepID=UPI001FD37CE0|nr:MULTISPECIES: urea ABC transporter permease subunit UrtB [Roseobacteraceae]MCJ7874269.1 urea ABC transporter permease subunit UrtB [Phaeobacter sp. J2-8]MDO6730699.1 urea ABC transporter permease subunit UrtB [Marinovum sp. 2_MG-2023]MDO6778850.1 urea ABC transporter permease subunit UrtB [Marinovum sp. 1_MG-2023]
MHRVLLVCLALLCLPITATAQDGSPDPAQTIQSILQEHQALVAKPSRRSIGTVLDALVGSGNPQVPGFLNRFVERDVWERDADGMFFYAAKSGDGYDLTDIDSGEVVATAVSSDGLSNIKPNGGVRREIGAALVQFQLSDPDINRRREALDAISRNPDPTQLAALAASIAGETDPALKTRKERLVTYLTARFGDNTAARIAAIAGLSRDLSVEGRAVLNQILTVKFTAANEVPEGANIARVLTAGDTIDRDVAYAALVSADLAPPLVTPSDVRAALEANIVDGRVGGLALARLGRDDARAEAYAALAAEGTVPQMVTDADVDAALDAHVFYEAYDEPDAAITDAAETALASVETRVGVGQTIDLTMDAVSLASIYFLAAIGLAITFGVMGVINMAHGEFIMMGAYTGYVVQLFIPDYTLSLIVALPLAFAVTFAAGVAMERLVIRWLYHRPLETLLATFGISIALQQLAKNIFGTQARPLTSPGWLDGAWVINDVVQISYIRIAIFVLALMFLALLLFILKKTRLGLEVRAVTQNPRMASSMGINPDRINMLTFGLGSGIAGIAGVAIGLYAKVTSEMGADYIVQSFMTVVVGGVGNVWGTLAGATLIGFLQKGIEFFNPSNTLAAQTYMILFIILFIQFRPKGIVALKGRAAGD